jgi:hypothetical protein
MLAPCIMKKWDLVTTIVVFRGNTAWKFRLQVLSILISPKVYSGFLLLFLSLEDISVEYSRSGV